MGVILRAHPVRGESHIQRNDNGEVATVHSESGQNLQHRNVIVTVSTRFKIIVQSNDYFR